MNTFSSKVGGANCVSSAALGGDLWVLAANNGVGDLNNETIDVNAKVTAISRNNSVSEWSPNLGTSGRRGTQKRVPCGTTN